MTTKSRQPFATPLHAVPSASVDQPWRTFLSAYCDRGWTNTHREIHTISYNHTQLQHLRFVEMIPQKMYETFPSDVLWSGNKTLLSICCDYVQPYIPILHSIFYVTACNRTQVTCSRTALLKRFLVHMFWNDKWMKVDLLCSYSCWSRAHKITSKMSQCRRSMMTLLLNQIHLSQTDFVLFIVNQFNCKELTKYTPRTIAPSCYELSRRNLTISVV